MIALRNQGKKNIVLRAVLPNAGLRARYQAELAKLIGEMHKSILYWLSAAYKSNEPEMAQDASPAAALQAVMNKLRSRWQSRFDEASIALAKYFAQAWNKRSDAQLTQILKDGGFSVVFRMTRTMNDVMQATIGEQVGLIRSIAQVHLGQVEGLVMRSVIEGRDLFTLSKEIQERYHSTVKRAALIARDQNNKATAAMNRVRQEDLGIDEAVWMHSHAGKEPRPEHVEWGKSKKRYKVSEGMWSEKAQKYIWPGTEINCRCSSRPIIPGFAA